MSLRSAIEEVRKKQYDWGTPESTAHAKAMTPGQNVKENDDKDDYEGDMAKVQLRAMVDQAQDLIDQFEDNENLPEWCQNKITKAADYIKDVYSYMEGLEKDDEEEDDD
jgi:exonuclease VII small subunit